MNKKDLIPIVILFGLFLAYPKIDSLVIAKYFPAKAKPAPAVVETAKAPDIPADTALASAPEAVAQPAEAATTAPDEAAEPVNPASNLPQETAEEKGPEVLTTLANDRVELTLSSHGAGVIGCSLIAQQNGKLLYPVTKGSDKPVRFDFSGRPAAAPIGYPGLAEAAGFEVASTTADSVVYRKVLTNGLVLNRTLTLGSGYQVSIEDQIENTSAAAIALTGYGLQAGFMENLPGEAAGGQQVPLLGVDTLTGSAAVQYWAAKFGKWFPLQTSVLQRQIVPGEDDAPLAVDWAAVKNKYFTQILTPEEGANSCLVEAACGAPVHSSFLGIFPRTSYPIEKVTASIRMPEYTLAAGQTFVQNSTWYIGPKVYAVLKANGPHQEDILQLGFWRVVGIWILKIMVWIHDHIWPYSYGLAIILLTFLIRIIFWPLNHKSMLSTRHMQEVQPIIAAMRAKFKDNPQRQQQEMMAIYKEHKINPMGGCLPMLIQIPVFFALFVVLRGAIELRFSSFLWIADLSTQENLFKNVLPIGINILPIFMGVTMWLQQKMTPTSDPQQQKMMMMMPVLFTFMFYSFPSGLSLYWSVNQVMMIVQLAWMKKRHPVLVKK
jgi:YidC/Oxa1 family membrane protein insertase